ncbi:MAG TPA: hypothetical protein VM051_10605 [Usitatibacter sp.]|nr:hypothetical protein [Usitatibacter sp.]
MSENGDKLGAAYRALPREEPGAAIDAAILAASRRALARPSASRRWAAPVSIAAVLVLAFGVSLHMQEEKPGIESPDLYARTPAAPPPAAAEAPISAAQGIAPQKRAKVEVDAKAKVQKKIAPAPDTPPKPDAAPSVREEVRSLRDEAAPAAPLAQAAPAVERERKDLAKEMDLNRAAVPAPAQAPAAAALSSRRAADAMAPIDEATRELEAIAKLRAENRHEEADKALAEFRRKRPDYRIAEAMWERVKPR